MNNISPNQVKTVGLIGGGTIGASWAAYFLARGLSVIVVDPFRAEAQIRHDIEQMWPALTQLGLAPEADPLAISFRDKIDLELAGVDFVQENGPENLALKQEIVTALEAVLRSETVISSSTSALLASDIQAKCQHPERVVVGHPFNPPHLIPLVEVVGGQETAPGVIDWTMDFYNHIGKVPVRAQKEAVGHIANRLTAALFREVVHLIAEGIASVEDIDAVMTNGPGLRWALIGPVLTYHLAGGSGGIQGYLDHLGPTQELRWQQLGRPQLTDEVKQQIVEGVLAEVGHQTLEALVQKRDADLIALLQTLK